MKRTIKLISITISMIIFIMSLSTSAFAFDDTKYVDAFSDEVIQVFETNRFGDFDGNDEVNAADARICLRAAAKIDAFEGAVFNAADIDGDRKVTSADARAILRASAKIEELNARVPVFNAINSKVVIGPLETAGSGRYVWYCTLADENAVDVDSYVVLAQEESSGIDGYPVQQFFEIIITDKGRYNVKLELKNNNNEVIDKFSFDIACYYTGDNL